MASGALDCSVLDLAVPLELPFPALTVALHLTCRLEAAKVAGVNLLATLSIGPCGRVGMDGPVWELWTRVAVVSMETGQLTGQRPLDVGGGRADGRAFRGSID